MRRWVMPSTRDSSQRKFRPGDLSKEQRLSAQHEQSLAIQSARFFKLFGLSLVVIGLCGGLYYQL